jgi:translocation and assembly module TamB
MRAPSPVPAAANGGAQRRAGLGIPLAWVDAFSLGDDDPPLEAAGISGDLSFNARWNLDTLGKDLKADLTVERAAGDLRLAVDDGSSTTVIQTTGPTATRAGGTRTRQIGGAGMRSRIKDIRLNVQAQGSQVNAKLLWDSERAGKLSADLRTQLSYQQDGWTLPATAPLSGQLHANMPDMGLWALFAPPGWRIQGTGGGCQHQRHLAGPQVAGRYQGRWAQHRVLARWRGPARRHSARQAARHQAGHHRTAPQGRQGQPGAHSGL